MENYSNIWKSMEEQLTLQRIRRNNEKNIFRIDDPMLADPAGKVPRSEAGLGGAAGIYENAFHYDQAAVDAAGSRKVLAYL